MKKKKPTNPTNIYEISELQWSKEFHHGGHFQKISVRLKAETSYHFKSL